MTLPRTIVKALYDYWSLVETLVLKSKDTPLLDRDFLERSSLIQYGQNREEADEAIRQLIGKSILLQSNSREEYQLHGAVRDFVLSLSQEQELGLSENIRVEVEEMQRIGDAIQIALSKSDLSDLQIHITKLGNRLQAIGRQLLHDRQAILNIADRAKTLPPGTTLAERYREVLDSFDHYIEPMVQLLQQDQNGFAALTERIEDQLLHAETLCEQIGALVSWKRRIVSTGRFLRTLRADARESLAFCRETLLPLREEFRKNNRIAISVAQLLAIARKKGMHRAVPAKRLHLGGSGRSQRVIPGRFAKSYMADVMNFRPQAVLFPESLEGSPSMQPRLRIERVLEDIQSMPENTLLLQWLLQKYPEQTEKEILRLYHVLVRHFSEKVQQGEQEISQLLPQHLLRYYPHFIGAKP